MAKSKAELTKTGTGKAGQEVEYAGKLADYKTLFTTSMKIPESVDVDERSALATCTVTVYKMSLGYKAINIALEVDLNTVPLHTVIGQKGGPYWPGAYDKARPQKHGNSRHWITIPCSPSEMGKAGAKSGTRTLASSGKVEMEIKAGAFCAEGSTVDLRKFPSAEVQDASVNARLTFDVVKIVQQDLIGSQEVEKFTLSIKD